MAQPLPHWNVLQCFMVTWFGWAAMEKQISKFRKSFLSLPDRAGSHSGRVILPGMDSTLATAVQGLIMANLFTVPNAHHCFPEMKTFPKHAALHWPTQTPQSTLMHEIQSIHSK
jgi:hypothetical protein